jgi:hypothetical protein
MKSDNESFEEQKKPPYYALQFLQLICLNHLYEEIEGDLIQKFEKDLKKVGEKRAKRRLLWNVVRFFRPGILLRNRNSIRPYPIMISNYLKFSLRNMRMHSVFTFINITGLVAGIVVCLLMLNYVEFEKSYDKFFPRSKDIVRVSYSRLIDKELQYSKAQIFPAVGETLKETIPAVESYTRMFPVTTHVEAVMMIDDGNQQKTFTESSVYAVDYIFLDIFPLEFIEGDRSTALKGIACLGLFGFTYFMTYQRAKEIGIRKTLGATMLNIIKLLSTEFAIVLLLAGAVTFPLSYYAGGLWLATYPVRIWLTAIDFILPVAVVAIFAVASILFLLIRSANTNATEALKHE